MKTYNFKGIILGMGIGLVISSIININIQDRILTDNYIRVEASKRGFVIIDPGDLISKDKAIDKNSNNKVLESNKYAEEIKIEITQGCSSDDTASILLDNGLIDNKDKFLEKLHEREKGNKIQYGSFVLKKYSNYDEIIDIITKSKANK